MARLSQLHRIPACRRGRAWLAVGLLVAWMQVAAATHDHVDDGRVGARFADCGFCVAQATPAAPSPAVLRGVTDFGPETILPPPERWLPAASPWRGPGAARAPPALLSF